MNKRLFGKLITSIQEAGRISRGETKAKRTHEYSSERVRKMRREFKPSQIVTVRKHLNMSQAEFADVMLIHKSTLQSWEQGRRRPEGPALVLIHVMQKNAKAVVSALHA